MIERRGIDVAGRRAIREPFTGGNAKGIVNRLADNPKIPGTCIEDHSSLSPCRGEDEPASGIKL